MDEFFEIAKDICAAIGLLVIVGTLVVLIVAGTTP